MVGASPAPRDDGLIARYEDLRRLALDRHRAQAQGLALFIRRGMAGWLQAWSRCTGEPLASTAAAAAPAVPAVPATSAPATQAHDICPVQLQNDVAMLLASMVLATRQEVSV